MNDARAKLALSASWLVFSCTILRFISSFERHVAFQLDARGLVIGCGITILGALVMVRPIRNVRKQPPAMDDLDISLAVLAISLSAMAVAIAL